MVGCMGYPWMCIVDTDGIEDRDLQVVGPIGTGPYIVTNYEKANILELAANENYWDGEAHYDVINAVYITDAKTRALALMDGEKITLNYVASNFRYLDVIPQAHMALIEAIGIDIELTPTDGHFEILYNQGPSSGRAYLCTGCHHPENHDRRHRHHHLKG